MHSKINLVEDRQDRGQENLALLSSHLFLHLSDPES